MEFYVRGLRHYLSEETLDNRLEEKDYAK